MRDKEIIESLRGDEFEGKDTLTLVLSRRGRGKEDVEFSRRGLSFSSCLKFRWESMLSNTVDP